MLRLAVLLVTLGLGSAAASDRPDPSLTPGVIDPALTQGVICRPGWRTASVRNVSATKKRAVYAAYRLRPGAKPCPCEVDHLVSLELGGSNDQENLWPQSYATRPWNALVKDRLEIRLHKLVCAGSVPLTRAQHEIAVDWIAAYKRYLGATP